MNLPRISAGLAGAALILAPCCVLAADDQAGTPLAPADAAGPWTLESGGRSICVVDLGKDKAGHAGLTLHVPAACGDALPAGLVGWAPTADGMTLVGEGGQPSIAFSRWSNSLMVSHRSSGVDLQLRRGGPNS